MQLYLNVNNVLLEYNFLYVYNTCHVIACRLECHKNQPNYTGLVDIALWYFN